MKFKIILLFAFCLFTWACNEEFNFPIEENSAITGNVSNVSVENTPGGAIITYSIPPDPSLLYVLAEVETKSGTLRQFKSSQYINTINIDGIGDTDTYNVKVYSVNKSEVRSEPISIEIKPLTPPFLTVFETVEVKEDFGGINIKFKNETESDLGFVLIATDSVGNFKQYGTYYSKQKVDSYTFRGMETKDTKIGVVVKDRWENTSDTLIAQLTPLYEIMLDKLKFRDITLPGDSKVYDNEPNIKKEFLWDNSWSTTFASPYGTYRNLTTNDSNDGTPHHITIDLGVNARLSRARISNYYTYSNRNMRKYEIWGHPGPEPNDGSWDGWVKLAYHEQVKPSGLPGSQYSDADKIAWEEGDNISFPTDISPIRYIRIKCIENWSGNGNMSIAEVTFWGSDRN